MHEGITSFEAYEVRYWRWLFGNEIPVWLPSIYGKECQSLMPEPHPAQFGGSREGALTQSRRARNLLPLSIASLSLSGAGREQLCGTHYTVRMHTYNFA